MKRFVPRLFRENEDRAKSFLTCKTCGRKASDCIPNPFVLYSSHCQNSIIYSSQSTSHSPITFHCETCSQSVPFICNCSPPCKRSPSPDLQCAFDFYNTPCLFHPNSLAEFFTETSFVPICNTCRSQTSERLKKITYRTIETLFFKGLNSVFNKICKDRKRRLVSYSVEEMLEVCRWMDQVENGVFCEVHKTSRAEFMNEELLGSCRQCASGGIALRPVAQAAQRVVEIVKARIKDVDQFCFNKYMLGIIRIQSSHSVTTDQSLNILILESRSVLAKEVLPYARCVGCYSKLTEGWKKGLQLKCGHLACFKCLCDKAYDNCPLDNLELAHVNYISTRQTHLLLCHREHEYKPTDEIYKLPCFHSSCSQHKDIDYCFQCGFSIDSWPEKPKRSNSIEGFVKFYDLTCLEHGLGIKHFLRKPYGLACEKCEVIDDRFEITDLKHLFVDYIDKCNPQVMENIKNLKSFDLCNDFMKLLSYIGVKNLNAQIKCVILLENLYQCSRQIPAQPLFISAEVTPEHIFSKKKRVFHDNSVVVFRFQVRTDVIFKGIVMSQAYFPYVSVFPHAKIGPKSITLKTFNEETRELFDEKTFDSFSCAHDGLELYPDIVAENKLSVYEPYTCVYLPFNKLVYELCIFLHPGFYYLVKPFKKLKSSLVDFQKIDKKQYGPGLVMDGSISSPIFGFTLAEVRKLINSGS